MNIKTAVILGLIGITLLMAMAFSAVKSKKQAVPLVCIIGYGKTPELDQTINGIKKGLAKAGYIDGKNIRYTYSDADFDESKIKPLLQKAEGQKPAVIVPLTTPVAQQAKKYVQHTPMVFAAVEDPVKAGLIPNKTTASANMTGAAEQQNLTSFLHFAKQVLPSASRIGLLYSPQNPDDTALFNRMQGAIKEEGMSLVGIPMASDTPVTDRLVSFKGKVDCFYIANDAYLRTNMHTIAQAADQIGVPVFSADKSAVLTHEILGSYGVSSDQVGDNASQLVKSILQGSSADSLTPIYPAEDDHAGYVSRPKAEVSNIRLSERIPNITYVEN